MGNKNGLDFIEKVHERSQHNINPYYWFNRVDGFTLAQMVASLAGSVIESVILSAGLIFIVVMMLIEGVFRKYLVVFSIYFVFWVLATLRGLKYLAVRRHQKMQRTVVKPKERKRKLPKRRKDYK